MLVKAYDPPNQATQKKARQLFYKESNSCLVYCFYRQCRYLL